MREKKEQERFSGLARMSTLERNRSENSHGVERKGGEAACYTEKSKVPSGPIDCIRGCYGSFVRENNPDENALGSIGEFAR
jgi:hypothetical protein